MIKRNEVTPESFVELLNNLGDLRFGAFNSNREYRDRATGEMKNSIFANISLQNQKTGERWFINRVNGTYSLKLATGGAAAQKPTSTSRASQGADKALEARFSKMETLLSSLAEKLS